MASPKKLPASDDEFLELLEGMTQRQMAAQYGVTQSAVAHRKAQILKRSPSITLRQPTYPRQPEWGLGGPFVHVPTTQGDEVVVGLFDLHWPHHEKGLLQAAIEVIQEIQPDVVILGGDVGDHSLLSRWEAAVRAKVPPGRLFKKVREDLAQMGDQLLRPLREAAPKATIYFLEGNHDERLRMWLMGEDIVEGIEMANEWMRLSDYDMQWVSRAGLLLRPEHLVRHGETTVTNAAKSEQEKTRCGGWIGHGHRWRHWHEELPETQRAYTTWMMPVMCRRDYDYGPGGAGLGPWPQGFAVGTFCTGDQYDYSTEIARWWKGRLSFRGRRY